MAPKRQPHKYITPTSDREHSSSSDDSDSEPQQLTQTKPHQTPQDSSDSGSSSDSDSDESQQPPSSSESKKLPQLKAKRPAETDLIEKASKSKKSKAVEEKVDKGLKSGTKKSDGDEEIEDKKGVLFARLFTEKDEIVLLEAMIDYKEKKGGDPSSNIVAFYEFVEDLLSCNATKSQVVDKIRRLKKKYVNNSKKGRDGKDPVFSRPHEFQSFELSKKIWGSEVNGDGKVKTSRRKKDDNAGSKMPLKSVGKQSDFKEEVMDKREVKEEDCWSLYPLLCASLESEANKIFSGPMNPKDYVKKVVSKLKKEKATELEQGWKGFSVMEHQVYEKRIKMISKQAEAVMNVVQH